MLNTGMTALVVGYLFVFASWWLVMRNYKASIHAIVRVARGLALQMF
jgi:hypothetical protein